MTDDVCTCRGRLAKIGPRSRICRSCRQLWRDTGMGAGWLTMVTPEEDLEMSLALCGVPPVRESAS